MSPSRAALGPRRILAGRSSLCEINGPWQRGQGPAAGVAAAAVVVAAVPSAAAPDPNPFDRKCAVSATAPKTWPQGVMRAGAGGGLSSVMGQVRRRREEEVEGPSSLPPPSSSSSAPSFSSSSSSTRTSATSSHSIFFPLLDPARAASETRKRHLGPRSWREEEEEG